MNDHFYRLLKIENFRGIQSLEIDGLARVNLFVGKNNCGKTSILESVFLLSGMSNPGLAINIDNWRGIALTNDTDLRNFFYDLKEENGFTLSGSHSSGCRKLEAFPDYKDLTVVQRSRPLVSNGPGDGNGKNIVRTEVASSVAEQLLSGLKYKFCRSKSGENSVYAATLSLSFSEEGDPAKFNVESPSEYKETVFARFPSGQIPYNPKLVEDIIQKKRKDVITRYLSLIEPKIQDVSMGMRGIVSVDIGLDALIPINLLGDGMLRMLAMLTYIRGTENGILMLDEIENGLHVSSIQHMLDMLIKYSRESNTQIFMTTHSMDVIRALSKISTVSDIGGDEVACFWIDKTETDRTRSYRYSPDDLKKAVDADIDPRH